MTKIKKVSIITTTYNDSHMLEKCIRSVRDQIRGSLVIDHIIWDDGSSDLSDFQKLQAVYPDVTYYFGVSNVGLAEARNRAVSKSDADAFIFLDSDDHISNNFVRDMVQASKGCKSPVYPSVQCFGSWDVYMEKPEWSKDSAMRDLFIPATSLVTREAFEAVNGFTAGLPLLEDFDMWYRMADAGFTGKACNSAILYYNIRKDSMSDHFNLKNRKELKEEVYRSIVTKNV